jgi:hypothetical protein
MRFPVKRQPMRPLGHRRIANAGPAGFRPTSSRDSHDLLNADAVSLKQV